MHFAVLHCLPASTMRAQYPKSAHAAVRAIVAQRAVHAALDMVHRAGFHQLDDRLVAGERRAGKPHQVARAHAGSRLKRVERDQVSVAQMMMAADGHAVAQPAKPQRRFQVRNPLVPVCGIVAVAANRRAVFMAGGTMSVDALIRDSFAAVDRGGHAPSGGIRNQGRGEGGAHAWPPAATMPICCALATSLRARCTTGASIIFEPRLTTPRPPAWASS